MNYNYQIPARSIAQCVNGILVIEDFNIVNPFTLPLFANGCPTLVFQTRKALLNKEPAGHFTLFGQTVKPGVLTIPENFTLVAYFFKPHALVSLFNIPGSELSDTHVDLNLLKSAGCRDVEEKLLGCHSANEMVLLLNSYILSLVNKQKDDASRLDLATTLIRKHRASDNLKSVQADLCVTEKTLQRMFESKIGISPRLYKRICQFDAAFKQLSTKNFSKLSEIAYEHNYADQSHFIRSFREFTNLTPTEYLQFSTPKA